MIDTQTVLPASVCAKADKYSFSDFLPRVISYFTVQGTQYAMPFNTSGPVLYYNKKAFTAAGPRPEHAADDARRRARRGREAQGQRRVGAARAQDRSDLLRALDRDGEQPVTRTTATAARPAPPRPCSTTPTGRQIFTWLSGMVKDGLATTNPDLGANIFDDLLGIRSGSHAMAIDTSAAFGTIKHGALDAGNDPNIELGVAPMPAPAAKAAKGGVFVQGGALFMVNKSAPEKQAAAWKFLKFLDQPENMTTWAIGTGYMPIRKSSANSPRCRHYWAQNPGSKVAYDQLLERSQQRRHVGLGDRRQHRCARRGARRGEQHVPRGHGSEGRAEGRVDRTPPPRSTTTTPASAANAVSLARRPARTDAWSRRCRSGAGGRSWWPGSPSSPPSARSTRGAGPSRTAPGTSAWGSPSPGR